MHAFRLYFRRLARRLRRGTEQASRNAGEQFEHNFLGRLSHIRRVWHLVIAWLLLFVLLCGGLAVQIQTLRRYYQTQQPVPGGIYSEGIEGTFTTANPLYAVSEVDTSVSRLLFAGLLGYDAQNHLVGDLADRWTVNDTGTIYTVHLRPNLTWHDGQPLTANDVVFTYHTIQEPDANSPLRSSWQGVAVAALSSRTITFTLPNPLSSFPYSLTNGIVPQHILGSVSVADLRSVNFDTSAPIGAGPFRWGSLGVSGVGDNNTEEQLSLLPFKQYWNGAPQLNRFDIHAFSSRDSMIKAYQGHAILSMVGLDTLPPAVAKDKSTKIYNVPLTAATFTFFKNTHLILQDAKVRQALVAAVDRTAIIRQLGYNAIPVDEPLLHGQLGYDPTYAQTAQPDQARALLDADGWQVVNPNGIRSKNGQPLTFTLYALNSPEYTVVARQLQSQWRAIGVDVKVQPQQAGDFQSTLSSHTYDAILYGISIGVDPDVFVYWDSSQADARSLTRLNFSEYNSGVADIALEAGRTRLGDPLRIIKYKTFLQAWHQDAPAVGLYQPRLLYISHVPIYGFGENQINTDADRFNNVQNWMIHTGWVTNQTT